MNDCHSRYQIQGFAHATKKPGIIESLLKFDHGYSGIRFVAKCSRQQISEIFQELKSAYWQ